MGYHSLLSFHFVNMNAFVSLVLLPQLSVTSWPLPMDTDLWLSKDSLRTSTRTDLLTLLARLSLLSMLLLPQLSKLLLLQLLLLSRLLSQLPQLRLPQLCSRLPQLSRLLLPQLSPPTLSLLPTMSATRSPPPSNTCPRSPSRRPSRPTPPTTSSTTPQLSEPSLDLSQLLPQLLLLKLLRMPQLSRRLRSPVDKNIFTTALKFMKLENI